MWSIIVIPFVAISWLLFRLPGKVLLWIEYYFPRSGQTYASGRRYGNPIIEVMYSAGFWLLVGGGGWYFHLVLIAAKKADAESQPSLEATQTLPPNQAAKPIYQLPACADQNVLAAVKSALSGTQSPGLQINEVRQINFDPTDQIALCSASVQSNSGIQSVEYQELWLNRQQGEWSVKVYQD